MAVVRYALLVIALLIVAVRLFTGVVYEYDDPTTYLVLKHSPSLQIVQENVADRPVRARFTVIDGDENELVYQRAYTVFMHWAFLLAACCAGSSVLLQRAGAAR
jgi:hypothetical protein